eukprot:Gb_03346 [translate_table: standard]
MLLTVNFEFDGYALNLRLSLHIIQTPLTVCHQKLASKMGYMPASSRFLKSAPSSEILKKQQLFAMLLGRLSAIKEEQMDRVFSVPTLHVVPRIDQKRMENIPDQGDLAAIVRASSGGRSLAAAEGKTESTYNNNNHWQLPIMGSFLGDQNKSGISSTSAMATSTLISPNRCINSSELVVPNLLNTNTLGPVQMQEMCNPFYSRNSCLMRSASISSSIFENIVQQSTVQSQFFSTASMFSSTVSIEKHSGENDQGVNYGFVEIEPEMHTPLNRSAEISTCEGSEDDKSSLEKKSCHTYAPLAPESGSEVRSKLPQYSPTTSQAEAVGNTCGKEEDGSSSPVKHFAADSALTRSNSLKGIKRRKTQQKRIICVPAAGGSNRPSGEGAPSDLWAWRKYGQKPIKGSPHPSATQQAAVLALELGGYYRCSSSKGCPARKQVERSRTDPTMLVITYTSDHNHPWPTQRNSLAGSTRHSTASDKLVLADMTSPNQDIEIGKSDNDNSVDADKNIGSDCNQLPLIISSSKAAVGQANELVPHEEDEFYEVKPNFINQEDHQAGLRIFRSDTHNDDLFADLGELPEPLNMFARHFLDDQSDDDADSSIVDPFNLFNWSSTPFVEGKTAM